ncbi:MAG: hypothetical protein MMC23_001474 [Stictis urceolatum]|nr:hypothetical protein [Stictis urceolata]
MKLTLLSFVIYLATAVTATTVSRTPLGSSHDLTATNITTVSPETSTSYSLDTAASSFSNSVITGRHFRIVALGASIVTGFGSSTGNGFRLPLYQYLTNASASAEYVGTQHFGSMPNNAAEAHSGWTVRECNIAINNSLPFRPNLILVHAGTNDVKYSYNVTNSAGQMVDMLHRLAKHDPDCVVLVAKLWEDIENALPSEMQAALVFNQEVKRLVGEPAAGTRPWVKIVDFGQMQGKKGIFGADKEHPTDVGYDIMGRIWGREIEELVGWGWFVEPR